MKKRITALLLVVVMLALALVSCGYSYSDDDMNQYAKFDKAAFEAAIASLVIEDGDFTGDPAIRANKVKDKIYETLAGKADTDAKVTTGVIGGHDKLFYCYYVTATVGEKQVVLFSDNMKQSSAANLLLGLTKTEDFAKEVETAFTAFDFTDKAYTTTTSGTIKFKNDDDAQTVKDEGKVAYISYKVTYKETLADNTVIAKEISYTNERVTLGDASHPVASRLDGAAIGSQLSSDFEAFKAEIDEKSYSNITVNWVVESGAEKEIKHTTYTDTKVVKDVTGNDCELKDVELTYHVYPVYFLEVEDFTAKAVLKTILTSYTTETTDDEGNPKTEYALPSLESNKEAIENITALREAYDKLESELEDLEEAVANAETALKTANESQNADTISQATDSLNTAKANRDAKDAELKAKDGEIDTAIDNLIAVITEAKVIEEYEKTIFDGLLDAYNDEIKTNVAGAVWEAMQAAITIEKDADGNMFLPEAAVQAAYDRFIEEHEKTFHTGTYNSTDNTSNYKQYSGNFRSYLMNVTGAKTYVDAKHEVWADAREYVAPIVSFYRVAAEYGLVLSKDELKALKEDPDKNFDYYTYYYGEDNVVVSFQFDHLMNYWLESETVTDPDTQIESVSYKKLGVTIKDKE